MKKTYSVGSLCGARVGLLVGVIRAPGMVGALDTGTHVGTLVGSEEGTMVGQVEGFVLGEKVGTPEG